MHESAHEDTARVDVASDAVGHDEEVAAHVVALAVRQPFLSGHGKIDRLVCVCVI
jgi:hypothetical protein